MIRNEIILFVFVIVVLGSIVGILGVAFINVIGQIDVVGLGEGVRQIVDQFNEGYQHNDPR